VTERNLNITFAFIFFSASRRYDSFGVFFLLLNDLSHLLLFLLPHVCAIGIYTAGLKVSRSGEEEK
jgi:hypothetical protein